MSSERYFPERHAPVPPRNSTSPSELFPPFIPRKPAQTEPDTSGTMRASSVQTSKGDNILVQEHEAKRRLPRWRDVYNYFMVVLPGGWSIEVVSSILSVGALLSIVFVLRKYDQQSMPSWPLGITLNTLLAFLTAISQSCFLHPVVQGLSQMKWNWFAGRDRPVVDFEKFDNASRGPWGSILLVFSTKGRLSVLLAAIILVTSAVTSTVTQAVLTQSTRYVPGPGEATVQRLVNDAALNYLNTNDALAMMMNAMYTRPNATYEFDAPVCSSGNCDFPSFGSLAVCAQTVDITDKLYTLVTPQQWCYQNATDRWEPWTWGPETCGNYSYAALSDSIWYDYFPTESLANTSNVWLQSNASWESVWAFEQEAYWENALNAVHIIYLDTTNKTWPNGTISLPNTTAYLEHTRALETLFYVCAEEYTVTTSNGTTVTNVTATLDHVTSTEPWEYTNDNIHYSPETNRTFTLNGQNYTYWEVNENLGQMLLTFFTGGYSYGTVNGLNGLTPFGYGVGDVLYHNDNINGNTATEQHEQMFQALGNMLNNTAEGLTNWFRSNGEPVHGAANVLEVYVVVRWPFLIFLATQIALSVCFLLWIVVDSKVRRTKILKESALAALYAIPASDKAVLEEQLANLMDDEEKDRRKREDLEQQSKARLVKNETGYWNLRLTDQKSETSE